MTVASVASGPKKVAGGGTSERQTLRVERGRGWCQQTADTAHVDLTISNRSYVQFSAPAGKNGFTLEAGQGLQSQHAMSKSCQRPSGPAFWL
jgi:hypothetical protein